MKARRTIQVFEYETLHIGSHGFDDDDFDRLVRFNDKHGGQYYSPGYRKITFNSYVGVIQVAGLTIEILPKAGREANKQLWHDALLGMLKISGFMNLRAFSAADLKLRQGSLLDVYLEVFISHCRRILEEGRVRRYRLESANRNALRGRLIFNEQLRRNLIHKERFYVAAQDYTRDNIFNQIVLKALTIVSTITESPILKKEAILLCQQMDDVSIAGFTAESFIRLKYDRTTERYRDAINLAELIILNYMPDLKGGTRSVLALLFRMEVLFEAYIAALLKKAALRSTVKISTQRSRHFWRGDVGGLKTIRPDIIIDWSDLSGSRRTVLDTKWKLPQGNVPADSDLKQMFVYNEYFAAESSNLVYPSSDFNGFNLGRFVSPAHKALDSHGRCSRWRVRVVDSVNQSLNTNLGFEMLQALSEKAE
jgi:5-methylcytosine-specific restriction enzyme subunit McrC